MEKTVIIRVRGMTCGSCELRIESALSGLSGTKEVKADAAKGRVRVRFDSGTITEDALREAIEAAGYTAVKPDEKEGFSVLQLAGIGVILAALFLFLGRTGLFNMVPEVNQTMGYGILFLIGVLTSLHCVAMCGGINLSQSVQRDQPAQDNHDKPFARLKPGLLYNGGRVISYTLIGGLAGALGSAISFSAGAQGIIVLLAGGFMILMGVNMLGLFPWIRKLTPRLPKVLGSKISSRVQGKGPLIVGLLNGLMPCGPLQSMQIFALGTGSFLAGALSMLLFSLGTVPLMLGFGTLSSLLSKRFQSKVMKISALLVVFLGVAMMSRGMSLSGVNLPILKDSSASVSIARLSDGYQAVTTTLYPSRYEPIIVQAGIPVRWTIQADRSSLNGCNSPVTIPRYGIRKKLNPGENIIEFTPSEVGDLTYTCWMGMITSTIRVVADVAKVSTDDLPVVSEGATASCCSGGDSTSVSLAIPTDRVSVATLSEGVQKIRMDVVQSGFSPSVLVLQKGLATEWNMKGVELTDSNYRLIIPAYDVRMELVRDDNVVNFVPEQDFYLVSWRGDFAAYVKVVDDLSSVNVDRVKEEVDLFIKKSGG